MLVLNVGKLRAGAIVEKLHQVELGPYTAYI